MRLTQEHGISFFFEHSEGKHRLVLIDNMGGFQHHPSAAYRQVEYHPPGWKTDAEYIHSFAPHHQLTSGRVSLRDYDYTRPRADLSISRKNPRATGQADAEVYQWHAGVAGSHYAQPQAGTAPPNDPHAEGRDFALLRMQALRTHGARAQARGNLRAMVPGCSFTLHKHPRQQANTDYLIPHTALVVGPEGQNLWTDAYGRIKVQFMWDRLGQKNQHSSCWVRVSSQWAGNQLGAMHIPRIGEEVLITFIGGDPDLPICTGKVYNQGNLPPWALPDQAALSGFRSRELTKDGGNSAAGRSNHLILDDTDQKIQAQLKSDHQSSSLSLGHITRIDGNAGRKDSRGEGFELRTDGHGAIRAKDGLLITTEARVNAESYIHNVNETIQRLTEARDLLEQVSAVAQRHDAQRSGTDQSDVLKAIKAQNAAIQGDGKAQGEFTAPQLVLASPAGIASSTPQSTHIASGQHTQLSTGAHLSIATGGAWYASVVDKFALFVQKAGMKLVAAAGKISLQAQSGDIELVANQVLALISQTDYVEIRGKKGVRLYGGNCMLEISDQTQFYTPSPVLFHGSLETLAPKSISQVFNAMPTSKFDQQVRMLDGNGEPADKVAYDLMRDDGNILNSTTAASGTTPLQKSPYLVRYTIRYKGELP